MKKKQKLLLKLLHSRTEANMCLFFFYEWFWEKRFLFLLWFISNLVVQIEKLTVGIYACSFSLTQVMTERPHGNPKKVYSRISLFSQNNDYKWNSIIRKLVQQLHHEKDSDTYWSKNVIGKMWSKVLKRKKKKSTVLIVFRESELVLPVVLPFKWNQHLSQSTLEIRTRLLMCYQANHHHKHH